MNAFGGGDLPKIRQMPPQHCPAHRLIIRIPHAVHNGIDSFHAGVCVNGCHRHQRAKIHPVLFCPQADAVNHDLRRAPVFRHGAPQLDDLALIGRAYGAGIVPHLGVDHAGGV